jgi:hypothetical protein
MLQVHAASVQDRDGAIPLLQASRPLYPFIERVFAGSAYAAERVANATRVIVEIVRKQTGQIGFAVHPRRWVVEPRRARSGPACDTAIPCGPRAMPAPSLTVVTSGPARSDARPSCLSEHRIITFVGILPCRYSKLAALQQRSQMA